MHTTFLRLTFAGLFLCAVDVHAVTHHVDLGSPGPAPPYTNWLTAATNLQDAIDVAMTGDLILVTNGVYQTGGRPVAGSALTNRVVVDKPLSIVSVNGPAGTTIEGHPVPGMTNGDGAVRCVYLTNNTVLAGFSIRGGATMAEGDPAQTQGGGIWCESRAALVTNCVIVDNAAFARGGGVYRGTLIDCLIISNAVPQSSWWGGGGGVFDSALNECTLQGNFAWYGGGGSYSTLADCLITGNWAWDVGGGAHTCTLDRCTLVGNLSNGGGGCFGGVLNQCLIASNSANWAGGTVSGILVNCTITRNVADTIGGAYCGALDNCIIYENLANSETNYLFDGEFFGLMNSSCATPLPPEGIGNSTQPPNFVNPEGGNFRLQSNSPCINAGNNALVLNTLDLDGNPRIVGGTVDIGAYEHQSPSSILSYAWAQKYGLPTDGSADHTDVDGDGMDNRGEWRADTIPTNPLSRLYMITVSKGPNGAAVTWQSMATRSYWLERAVHPGFTGPFQTVATNIAGMAGSTTFTDTTATDLGPCFYRAGVQ